MALKKYVAVLMPEVVGVESVAPLEGQLQTCRGADPA